MIKIAVCDNEIYYQKFIQNSISNFFANMELPIQIDLFCSWTAFLQLGIEIAQYEIVFLDVNMEGIHGIDTVKKIRDFSANTYLVFVTRTINYSLEGYKVEAIRYLLKNDKDLQESIEECLHTILSKMNCSIPKIKLKFIQGEKELPIDQILYIESRLHKLEFHILGQEIAVYHQYGTLNALESKLKNHSFLRIHQSFLVNLKHIRNIESYTVTLSNHKKLNIPKARYKEEKNTFLCFHKNL